MSPDNPVSLRPMLIEAPLRVNGYDIDVMGIVSNIVYIRWFEDLRYLFLAKYWPYQEMLNAGVSPILGTTHAEYRAPLTIHDVPTGRIWAEEMNRLKWRVHFEITSEKGVHCTGYQVGFLYDLTRRKPIRMPDSLIAQYEESRSTLLH